MSVYYRTCETQVSAIQRNYNSIMYKQSTALYVLYSTIQKVLGTSPNVHRMEKFDNVGIKPAAVTHARLKTQMPPSKNMFVD